MTFRLSIILVVLLANSRNYNGLVLENNRFIKPIKSGTLWQIDGDQTRLRYLIESLKLESQWVDVTTDSIILKRMREECGNPKALPPQIFNDDVFLGVSIVI